MDYDLVREGVECKSNDTELEMNDSIEKCADVCKQIEGCNFFIFGKGKKAGKCFWEKAVNSNCPEGWEPDDYNFYKMKGMLY